MEQERPEPMTGTQAIMEARMRNMARYPLAHDRANTNPRHLAWMADRMMYYVQDRLGGIGHEAAVGHAEGLWEDLGRELTYSEDVMAVVAEAGAMYAALYDLLEYRNRTGNATPVPIPELPRLPEVDENALHDIRFTTRVIDAIGINLNAGGTENIQATPIAARGPWLTWEQITRAANAAPQPRPLDPPW